MLKISSGRVITISSVYCAIAAFWTNWTSKGSHHLSSTSREEFSRRKLQKLIKVGDNLSKYSCRNTTYMQRGSGLGRKVRLVIKKLNDGWAALWSIPECGYICVTTENDGNMSFLQDLIWQRLHPLAGKFLKLTTVQQWKKKDITQERLMDWYVDNCWIMNSLLSHFHVSSIFVDFLVKCVHSCRRMHTWHIS